MAVRTSMGNKLQFGAEVTPGTAVPANKRFLDLNGKPSKTVNSRLIRGTGMKDAVAVSVGHRWASFPFEGGGYDSLKPLLSAHLEVGVTAANVTTYTPDSADLDTITTLSIEYGQSLRAESMSYGFVPDLQIRFTLTEVNVSGLIMARAMAEGVTLTATPTDIAAKPISPADWQVSLGPTQAGLVALTSHVLEAEFSSQGRWKPRFYANQAQESYTEHQQEPNDAMITVTAQHNTDVSAYMDEFDTGDTVFVKIDALSSLLAAVGVPYHLEIIAAGVIMDAPRVDNDGVDCSSLAIKPIYNATFGRALQVVLASA